jgi:hypothetical protein
MKISRIALSAMIAGACFGGTAFGQTAQTTNSPYKLISHSANASGCADATCDTSSCDSDGCDGLGHGCGAGFGLLGNCCLGEPWKLCENDLCGWNIGGWSNVGYHSANTYGNFNNKDGVVQLQQQWFFAEKIADGSKGLDLGGRIDYLYGTDAPDTQAFGIANRHWDNGWDQGAPAVVNGVNVANGYGHAIPQAYGEVAYNNLSVKVGKFFTIVGNEVVAATGNFFYSRQFTFYNAEPFTHTGALTTYKADDDTQLYNGWVSGWDSGFERNGSAYIGGFKRQLTEKSSFLYTTVAGRFGKETAEDGYVHNFIFSSNLTEKLTFISQTDVLYTTNALGEGRRNTFGNINYLLYKVNDCVSLGQRFEYFNYDGVGFAQGIRNNELLNYTVGVNYRATANLMFRPEVRWVWDRDAFGFLEGNRKSQAIFGSDMIFTF